MSTMWDERNEDLWEQEVTEDKTVIQDDAQYPSQVTAKSVASSLQAAERALEQQTLTVAEFEKIATLHQSVASGLQAAERAPEQRTLTMVEFEKIKELYQMDIGSLHQVIRAKQEVVDAQQSIIRAQSERVALLQEELENNRLLEKQKSIAEKDQNPGCLIS